MITNIFLGLDESSWIFTPPSNKISAFVLASLLVNLVNKHQYCKTRKLGFPM